jgi:alanine racemase
MSRPARALLDADALRRNLQCVREHAPHSQVMAIVKANAYGHGLEWAARSLADAADAFGVASVEEGVRLRRVASLARHPICLLEGFFTPDELPLLIQHELSPVIHHEAQMAALEALAGKPALTVWIKLDTGMHRIGFPPEKFSQILERLQNFPCVKEIRVISHLANADNTFDTTTQTQIELFHEHTAGKGLDSSLANSAGILAWPDSHLQWVRPGIMLYGASPLIGSRSAEFKLKPVMTLCSALIAINQRRRGDVIGYGGDWCCPEDMAVGVVAMGYGDGYPRHVPPGTPVLINGTRAALIGRVSMDLITVDLRAHPKAKLGDPVILWGTGLPVDEIAAKAGTISYELLCQVSERVPRIVMERMS